MSQDKSVNVNGMGLSGWLTVLFVGLKLTGHITWPWVWVLSPLWIGFMIWLAIVLIVLAVAVVAGVFK